jgi:hypothetical protein
LLVTVELYIITFLYHPVFILFMKRRSALKNVTLAVGGLFSLPAWASNWTPDSVGQISTLPVNEENLLAEIVETIIPETATPGAKTLKVHQFIMRMINDCYGEEAQKSLKQGLTATDQLANQNYNKPFISCDATQRKAIFTNMLQSSDAATKRFAEMTKNLTIRGYMNSEYVMVNILKYNMVPGFYNGCVPVQS